VDLSTQPLPLFDPAHSAAGEWPQISAQLMASDALVVISPEWHGMVPSALKNFFLYCGQKEVGHKPAFIITVSSGVGGSYPVDELRGSSYKNNRLLYLPEQVIIRHVGDFLLHYPNSQDEIKKNLQGRLDYGLKILHEYAKALKVVRESEVFNPGLFTNGM
jgi:NAD(P)H-dependent FMN reductase